MNGVNSVNGLNHFRIRKSSQNVEGDQMIIHTSIGNVILTFMIIVFVLLVICFGYFVYDIYQGINKIDFKKLKSFLKSFKRFLKS